MNEATGIFRMPTSVVAIILSSLLGVGTITGGQRPQ